MQATCTWPADDVTLRISAVYEIPTKDTPRPFLCLAPHIVEEFKPKNVYIGLTIEEAREVGNQLILAADQAERIETECNQWMKDQEEANGNTTQNQEDGGGS